ncbi:pyrroline-5-carboxylate reductase [Bermanella sp. WJH001]|uniref:pyrroline-5-carboxylate reductase n=1 Tax=Bermanella sp. WJH001 TaxID=3048005 RepID=UPI0024BD9045|nr:pyrroline-5-carboxylate reductase [Bermanella sp. WJH001]MDJ1538976.1 pyrroline-5-carboxylate reductase [Bermanella sp. WJH001]
MTAIAFIGGGNMASAILGGLIENGYDSQSIFVSDPSQEKLDELAQQFNVNTNGDNEAVIAQADVVILAVKPQVMQQVIAPLKSAFDKKKPLIISVAAGISLESLSAWTSSDLSIVRCMPNTPALVQQGASGLLANQNVSDDEKALTNSILSAVGISVWVNSETELDAVTALSGSGPAYFFLFIESMISAGEQLGLTAETAKQLALQTALGAATMASKSELEPAQLRKNVTSPNGTTEQAILSFQKQGLEASVKTAMEAAFNRSIELSKELAK